MPYFIISICGLAALYIVRISLGTLGKFSGIEMGFATIHGHREINADIYDWAYHEDEILLAVADGIGDDEKGRKAAEVAVSAVVRMFEITGSEENPNYYFNRAFHAANNTVLRYIPDGSAGTNLLCAVVREGLLYYALAGNCQIAVYRGGELIPLSEGHTIDKLAEEAFAENKITRNEAIVLSQKRKIYNFLGKYEFHELELFEIPVILYKNDIVVLMTDGVYEHISWGNLENQLASKDSCQNIANNILKETENHQGVERDNGTLIVTRINS